MTDDNTQDVSGIPANDLMAQLELQRKLKMADALKNAEMPQGQMISGHYVPPSWTQQLANAVGTYKGGKAEKEALNQYGEYAKSQQEKLGKAVETYDKAISPEEIKTMKDNFITQPLQMGANVATSPSYSPTSQSNEQVAQVYPNFNGQTPVQNMQGETSVNQPIESTTYRPRTQTEKMQAAVNFGKDTNNPNFLNKVVLSQTENILKTPESLIEKVNPKDFTGESLALYQQTRNPKDLQHIDKSTEKYKNVVQDKSGNSFGFNTQTNQFEQIPGAKMATESWSAPYKVGGESLQRNANTGEIRKVSGTADGDKPPAGYVWSTDANGQKILTSIAGGPADKSLNPTESQANAYLFSSRMEKSDKILAGLEGKYNPMTISIKTSGKTSAIPGGQAAVNAYMSPQDQMAEQAQRDFINAALRRESGAAINQSEFDNANIQYFPQPNDSKEVLSQKAANRKTAIEGIKKAAGSMIKPAASNVVNFEDLK